MTHSFPTLQVAKAICDNSGWSITSLELQKLLYISHMIFLGVFGFPLINSTFKAWRYGPVSREVYDKVKKHGAGVIDEETFKDVESIDGASDAAQTITEVYVEFSQYSASELIDITHRKGGAWDRTELNQDIPDEYIAQEFHDFYE